MLQKKHAEYKVLAKQLIRKWKTLVRVNKDRIMTTVLKDGTVRKLAANQKGKKVIKVTIDELTASKQMSFKDKLKLNNNQPQGKKKTSTTVVD